MFIIFWLKKTSQLHTSLRLKHDQCPKREGENFMFKHSWEKYMNSMSEEDRTIIIEKYDKKKF